jgi:hypothetical protein
MGIYEQRNIHIDTHLKKQETYRRETAKHDLPVAVVFHKQLAFTPTLQKCGTT